MSKANSSVAYLQSLRARDVMSKKVFWADGEDSVQTTLATMDRCGADYVLLRSADKLDGIVSRSDLMAAVSPYLRPQFCQYRRLSDDATLQIKIKWVASRPVYTTQPDTAVMVVMEKMCRFGGKCLPVVDESNEVQGLMLISEILTAICPTEALRQARDGVTPEGGNSKAPAEHPEPEGAEEIRSTRHLSEDEVPKENQMEPSTMVTPSQDVQAEIQGSLNTLEQHLDEKLLELGSGLDKILQNIGEPTELRSKLEARETELQAVWEKLDKSNAQVATFQEDRLAEQAQMKQALEQQSLESTRLSEALQQQTEQCEQLRSQLSAKTAECQAAQDLLETQKRESQEPREQLHSDRDPLTPSLEQQSEELPQVKEALAQQTEQSDQLQSQLGDQENVLEATQNDLETEKARNEQAQKELLERHKQEEELIVQLQEQCVELTDLFADEEKDRELDETLNEERDRDGSDAAPPPE